MSRHGSSLMEIAEEICLLGHASVSIVPNSDRLLGRLAQINRIEAARTNWWESLSGAISCPYGGSCGSWKERIAVLLAEMGDPVFLAITDDEPLPWPVLRVELGKDLIDILSGMHFFEYFVFSENCSKIFFDTHENVLICSQ